MGAKTVLWDISKEGKQIWRISRPNFEYTNAPDKRDIVTKIMLLSFPGLKETTNILSAMGGDYKELIVDISKKEDVYKAADIIRESMGDVSILSIVKYLLNVVVWKKSGNLQIVEIGRDSLSFRI